MHFSSPHAHRLARVSRASLRPRALPPLRVSFLHAPGIAAGIKTGLRIRPALVLPPPSGGQTFITRPELAKGFTQSTGAGSGIKSPPVPNSCAGRCSRHEGALYSSLLSLLHSCARRCNWHKDSLACLSLTSALFCVRHSGAGCCNRQGDSSSRCRLTIDHCELPLPARHSSLLTHHYSLTPLFPSHRQPLPAKPLFAITCRHRGVGVPDYG